MYTSVLATKDSSDFTDSLASCLQVERFEIERWNFKGGEKYYRILLEDTMDLAGKDVVFVASTHTDQNLLELYRVGCALSTGFGVRRKIFVIPFLGYSTMEKSAYPGEIVVAKSNARLLSNIPGKNFFLLLDLHNDAILHYFESSSFRAALSSKKILIEGIRELYPNEDFVVGSADMGRPKIIEELAAEFCTQVAFVRKWRDFEKTHVVSVIGDVANRHVLIYDDMTRSADSLINAAEEYLKVGASSVSAVLSHLALNDDSVIKKLIRSPIEKIITTNSHPMSYCVPEDRFIVLDVVPLFSDAIEKILGI